MPVNLLVVQLVNIIVVINSLELFSNVHLNDIGLVTLIETV